MRPPASLSCSTARGAARQRASTTGRCPSLAATCRHVNPPAIFSALLQRGSPYAAVVAAVLELSGQRVQAVAIVADEAMDDVWQEPEAFDGCSTKGQSKPGEAQPIHIVRKSTAPIAATPASAFAKVDRAQGARI